MIKFLIESIIGWALIVAVTYFGYLLTGIEGLMYPMAWTLMILAKFGG